MGTAAISDGDYIHSCMHHADLILLVGHDTVEKPPFIMDATDTRTVIHLNYFGAKVRLRPEPLTSSECDVALSVHFTQILSFQFCCKGGKRVRLDCHLCVGEGWTHLLGHDP